MRKLFWVSLSLCFAMAAAAFIMPSLKRVSNLPDNMVVTYSDIQKSNETDKFSSFIDLELPKNINVASNGELTDTVMSVKLFNLFTIKKVKVRLLTDTDVYVGGETVGFNLFSDGVICVGSNAVVTKNGTKEPIKASGLMEGDAILKIEGNEIDSVEDIDRIINTDQYAGKQVELTILRNGENKKVIILPEYDVLSQKYKMGLWVRNSASGVGTLTYVKKSDFRFGAVGHPIVDESLGENFEIERGNIYKCKLVEIKKARKTTRERLDQQST